jgi:hypothetical protein
MLTKVGPKRGPRRYHPNTLARLEGTNISLIVPPPFAMPTLPKKPDNVLIAISVSTLGARALGICSSAKMVKQTRYSFLRPKVSLSGARNSGPMPSMTTKPVVHPMTMLLVVPKSSAICWIPGVNMDDARGERMLMAAMTATLAILVRCGHCLGLEGIGVAERTKGHERLTARKVVVDLPTYRCCRKKASAHYSNPSRIFAWVIDDD